ncbi:MAG: PAC2 family protein [SAR202 cluster bacterium]|nr:PAC2 family protein [SAR202 cluster bacterium]
MEFLKHFERPDVRNPVFMFAFAGWTDAAESATHALKYVVQQFGATKFAEVDPEEFYDFTQVRPQTGYDADGNRKITWPANQFFFWKSEGDAEDIVVFTGIEPSLKWRTFSESLVHLIKDLGTSRVVHVGALLDAVPHTRETRITGTATSPELQALLKGVEMRRSRYVGPTGISGVLMDALRRADVPSVSIWGHAPHYLQVAPNPKVSLRLVEAMEQIVRVRIDAGALRSQGASFERRVAQALLNEADVANYVRRLEAQWDRALGSGGTADDDGIEMPDPQEAVRDLEEFLRRSRKDDSSSGTTE